MITQKLNHQGLSHVLLPLIVILVIAVGGAFYLVSSNAATQKKIKVRLVPTQAAIDSENVAHIAVELRTRKGQPVTFQTCNGYVEAAVADRNGTTVSPAAPNNKYGARWKDNACTFAIPTFSIVSKKGNARATVVYHGSEDYYSAKKSFSVKRNKTPKLGPVIVAPAQ